MSFDTTGTMGEPRPSVSRWRAVAVAIGVTVLAFLATLVASIAFLVPLFWLDVDVEQLGPFVGLLVVGQVTFLVVAVLVAWLRDMRIPVEVPSLTEVSYALGGTVAALVTVVLLSILIELLGVVPGSVLGDMALADPTILLWIGVLSVVLVAPAEEFLFRGVVQGTLREAFGPWSAVAGASLLFGSLHLSNYTGVPEAVVAGAAIIVVTGSVLGVLYELTDNLAVPIIAHGLYNLVLSLLAFLTL